jgi:telomere length regulation protein
MEELLRPVGQVSRKSEDLLTISDPVKVTRVSKSDFKGTSSEEALETLKHQPSYDELISVLGYLRQGWQGIHVFNVHQPSPEAAQIIHILVTEIVPNYWEVIKESTVKEHKNPDLKLMLDCLLSVTGINAVVSFIRALIQQAKNDPKGVKQSNAIIILGSVLDLASHLLEPEDQLQTVWRNLSPSMENSARARAIRQEFISLVAGGKIVSLSAEAEILLREAETSKQSFWVADSKLYVRWLGTNLKTWIRNEQTEDSLKLCAELLSKSLKLGHAGKFTILFRCNEANKMADMLVQDLYERLLFQDQTLSKFPQLLDHMPQLDQRRVLTTILRLLASRLPVSPDKSTEDYPMIWAAAGVLKSVIGASQVRKGHLITWLTDASGAGLGEDCGIRRAAIAVLGKNKEAITTVLERSLNQFGDQLYIKHSPILQQEGMIPK